MQWKRNIYESGKGNSVMNDQKILEYAQHRYSQYTGILTHMEISEKKVFPGISPPIITLKWTQKIHFSMDDFALE